MRSICCVVAVASLWFLAGPAAGYQPAPCGPTSYYEYQVIEAYRGQGCTMPPSFSPEPICCQSACCCCLHVWDNYCQSKQRCCRCRCRCGSGVPVSHNDQPLPAGCGCQSP